MIPHLHNTRLQIEKFVYEKGTNVALYNAEQSKRYQSFQLKIQKALLGQIKLVAKYKEHLPLLMSLAKIKDVRTELLSQVSVLISKDKIEDRIDLSLYLDWAGEQGGQAFLDKVGINSLFGLKDQRIIDYFRDYSHLILDSVDDYTKKWIASKIQEGKDNGLTPFQLQQMLYEEGQDISEIRAERIVLTETAKALTTVELEAANRNNIQDKIWRTSLDERVCPICQPLDGEQVETNVNFSVGVQGPPAHVTCRCYIEWVIPDGWVLPSKIWIGQ